MWLFTMPPILKVVFILLGIAPLLRLIINTVVFSCVTIVVLCLAIASGIVSKWTAFALVLYSSFSLLCLVLARKSTNNRKIKYVEWNLVRKSAVRVVGSTI